MFTRKKESSKADILRSLLPTPCGQPKKILSPLSKGWQAIAKLKPLSLFISLLLMLKKAC